MSLVHPAELASLEPRVSLERAVVQVLLEPQVSQANVVLKDNQVRREIVVRQAIRD